MGADRRRAYSWGDARPARCLEDQCCAPAGYDGPTPGICDGELTQCPEDGPGPRTACYGVYNGNDPDCADIDDPAPVYANVDGATPEGLLNMTGNVGEWVFDWDGPFYDGVSTTDPVGLACDLSILPKKRATRGQAYTGSTTRLGAVERQALFDATRAPFLGFRCGRTVVPGDRLCDPGTQDVAPTCRPGFDFRTGDQGRIPPEACGAPDFANSIESERAQCPGLQRGAAWARVSASASRPPTAPPTISRAAAASWSARWSCPTSCWARRRPPRC